ncbi:hypothetical protein PBY51_025034 [Eleginops maclovinus]|uniref:Transmembrane protein 45B n=1 Tax=Eleginops maclovinus TaxID=56733 RepID=A0AAN7Y0W2_ELEMC|nr:hypothetical protein PBY51_025034 [Eleginops maclovinus]
MGSFKGHALPGTFFLLAGVWWGMKHSLCFATRRSKSCSRVSSRASQRRLELVEGSAVLFCSVVGMLLEQFAADGPALQLYDSSEHHWRFLMNWQHSTMYLFFALSAAVSLVVQSSEAAPLALDRLMLAVAFFNEGFLFLYHLHGRSPLDVHVHQLLLFCVFGLALLCFLEIFHRGNLVLELLRCTLTMLQGSWFWQIGFVLYPPSGLLWDQTDHNNLMFVTMCFSWHLAFAMLTISGIYAAVTCVVRSRLRRTPPMEMGLLKPRDGEPESEDEIL